MIQKIKTWFFKQNFSPQWPYWKRTTGGHSGFGTPLFVWNLRGLTIDSLLSTDPRCFQTRSSKDLLFTSLASFSCCQSCLLVESCVTCRLPVESGLWMSKLTPALCVIFQDLTLKYMLCAFVHLFCFFLHWKQIQWDRNGGRCGVCGDRWDIEPRDNEAGGRYANGIIGWVYRQGSVAEITVQITVSHRGRHAESVRDFKQTQHRLSFVETTRVCLQGKKVPGVMSLVWSSYLFLCAT